MERTKIIDSYHVTVFHLILYNNKQTLFCFRFFTLHFKKYALLMSVKNYRFCCERTATYPENSSPHLKEYFMWKHFIMNIRSRKTGEG